MAIAIYKLNILINITIFFLSNISLLQGIFVTNSIQPTTVVTEGNVNVTIHGTTDCYTKCIVSIRQCSAGDCGTNDRLYKLQVDTNAMDQSKSSTDGYDGALMDRYTVSGVARSDGFNGLSITIVFSNLLASDNGTIVEFRDGSDDDNFNYTLLVEKCPNFVGAENISSALFSGDVCDAYTANCITTFECGDLYYNNGNSNVRTCGTNATWNDMTDVCNLKCVMFAGANVSNTLNSCQYYEHGCQSTLQCNVTHYNVTGTSLTKTCVAPGQWDNSEEICQIKCENVFNGTAAVANATCEPFHQGCDVTFQCINGFSSGSGAKTRTCQMGATWNNDADDICVKSCESFNTTTYTAIYVNVSATCSLEEYFALDCGAVIGCSESYVGEEENVTCSNSTNPAWVGNLPNCIERCPMFSDTTETSNVLSNGTTCRNRYDSGCIVTFECTKEGQYSSSTRTCGNDGTWDDSNHPCVNKCNDFNGASVKSTLNSCVYNQHGCQATFQCMSGYVHINGTNLVKLCVSPGTWDNTEEICEFESIEKTTTTMASKITTTKLTAATTSGSKISVTPSISLQLAILILCGLKELI